MRSSKLAKALKLALPFACATVISACAYDPVTNSYVTAPHPGAPAPATIDNPDVAFDRLDVNRDGFLSRAELDVLLVSAPPGPVEAPDLMYRRLDVNNDGFLSRAEASVVISTIPGATFDQIDANRDGFLNYAEAEPHLRWYSARSPLYGWFDSLDTNRDGFLTRAEAVPLLRSTRYVAGRWQVSSWPPVGSTYPPYGAGAVYGPPR